MMERSVISEHLARRHRRGGLHGEEDRALCRQRLVHRRDEVARCPQSARAAPTLVVPRTGLEIQHLLERLALILVVLKGDDKEKNPPRYLFAHTNLSSAI